MGVLNIYYMGLWLPKANIIAFLLKMVCLHVVCLELYTWGVNEDL